MLASSCYGAVRQPDTEVFDLFSRRFSRLPSSAGEHAVVPAHGRKDCPLLIKVRAQDWLMRTGGLFLDSRLCSAVWTSVPVPHCRIAVAPWGVSQLGSADPRTVLVPQGCFGRSGPVAIPKTFRGEPVHVCREVSWSFGGDRAGVSSHFNDGRGSPGHQRGVSSRLCESPSVHFSIALWVSASKLCTLVACIPTYSSLFSVPVTGAVSRFHF